MSEAAYTWPAILSTLLDGADLSAEAAAWAMDDIMSGNATSAQMAGFAVALRTKGETVDEVGGMVRAMYEHATPLDITGPALDIVGTGGDRAHTVNISTMASITAVAAGARVVKHGNRAASSSSGSADLVEQLGIRLDLDPADVARIVDEAGITFCFAPVFHPALRFASGMRRELGVPTTFNFLGPLANPARPTAQAVGVADARTAPIMAGVLADRGCSALVFRGDDGLDELTTTTTSAIWEVRDGSVVKHTFDPADLGVAPAPRDALRGGEPVYNAEVARRYFAGETGPVRDAVLLNAAAGLVAFEPGDGSLTDRLGAALDRAAAALDSGGAVDVVERWVRAAKAGRPAG
jgi:anthranilate phosphoribosyltransferase